LFYPSNARIITLGFRWTLQQPLSRFHSLDVHPDPLTGMSLIVPAHNAVATLRACLEGLERSDVDRSLWELIVVDDASDDATVAIARDFTELIIATGAVPRGPAYARNRGADAASREILVFVDSDVVVHPDTLRRMIERLQSDSSLAAVFGSYDDNPAEPSRISRYRNLLHHYAHHKNAGKVPTFWAGCGAVRSSAFAAIDGFDEQRYPRPQIEDIELGYRLRQRGDILLDPSIQGTHHKRWTLGSIVRTDLLDRAIPWTELLLATGPVSRSSTPSLGMRELMGTATAGLAVVAVVLAVFGGGIRVLAVAAVLAFATVSINAPFYGFLRKRGGVSLALVAVPLHFFYQLLSAIAVPIGFARHLMNRTPARSR
jgi:GT2 family glycosyltransferase